MYPTLNTRHYLMYTRGGPLLSVERFPVERISEKVHQKFTVPRATSTSGRAQPRLVLRARTGNARTEPSVGIIIFSSEKQKR